MKEKVSESSLVFHSRTGLFLIFFSPEMLRAKIDPIVVRDTVASGASRSHPPNDFDLGSLLDVAGAFIKLCHNLPSVIFERSEEVAHGASSKNVTVARVFH